MGDPRSDPRALRLLAVKVSEVEALVAACRRLADEAGSATSGLRGAAHDGTWSGHAADAYRHALGKLPAKLSQVHTAYTEAGDALDRYAWELAPLQTGFLSIAQQLQAEQASLARANARLAGARSTLNQATSQVVMVGALPGVGQSAQAALTNAQDAVQAAGSDAANAQGQVSALERQGYQILEDFDNVRHQARGAVDHAAGAAKGIAERIHETRFYPKPPNRPDLGDLTCRSRQVRRQCRREPPVGRQERDRPP
ncbi:MAG: hypothetical protein M3Z27_02455 [Actinomycetota bacterium]|nr:hypothetical protein [Actinomycetota bacterium]